MIPPEETQADPSPRWGKPGLQGQHYYVQESKNCLNWLQKIQISPVIESEECICAVEKSY